VQTLPLVRVVFARHRSPAASAPLLCPNQVSQKTPNLYVSVGVTSEVGVVRIYYDQWIRSERATGVTPLVASCTHLGRPPFPRLTRKSETDKLERSPTRSTRFLRSRRLFNRPSETADRPAFLMESKCTLQCCPAELGDYFRLLLGSHDVAISACLSVARWPTNVRSSRPPNLAHGRRTTDDHERKKKRPLSLLFPCPRRRG